MKGKIFNAQEVQSIIAGNKTMFRGIVKKLLKHFDDIKISQDGEVSAYNKTTGWYEELKNIKCSYEVGQKIFVKTKQEDSHLILEIKNIRAERLTEISRGDCMAEGCSFPNIAKETNPKEWFENYWNATHKKSEEEFKANPWVWVVEFEVINN